VGIYAIRGPLPGLRNWRAAGFIAHVHQACVILAGKQGSKSLPTIANKVEKPVQIENG
jgi:hypothetical protein